MSRFISRREFLAGAASIGLVGLNRSSAARLLTPTLSLLPFLSRPTTGSIVINARNGHRASTGHVQIRAAGEQEWSDPLVEASADPGAFYWWHIDGLSPDSDYEYRVRLAHSGGEPARVSAGRFTTQRTNESSFVASLITDAHTGSFTDGQAPIQVLDDVVRNVRADQPDFVLALGDNVAWRTSRNEPQTDGFGAERAYDLYRKHLGPLTMNSPHFGLIGNWEGESGKLPANSIETVSAVRHRFTPGPNASTYVQGGSDNEDYYAFGWGPALFVVLNVQSYTRPSGEAPSARDDVSVVEDWTLGEEQFAWAERTLAASDHPFKFVCCHHAVAGAAGNESETLYGRGGAQAAHVGEQARLHELMLEYGVQVFFYGHDHVFVDDVVDGLHYAMPGSAGAPWHFGREVTGYSRFWPESGHARLEVRPEAATVQYLSLSGRVFHEFGVLPG